jgi:hypothetical protein
MLLPDPVAIAAIGARLRGAAVLNFEHHSGRIDQKTMSVLFVLDYPLTSGFADSTCSDRWHNGHVASAGFGSDVVENSNIMSNPFTGQYGQVHRQVIARDSGVGLPSNNRHSRCASGIVRTFYRGTSSSEAVATPSAPKNASRLASGRSTITLYL